MLKLNNYRILKKKLSPENNIYKSKNKLILNFNSTFKSNWDLLFNFKKINKGKIFIKVSLLGKNKQPKNVKRFRKIIK